MSKSEKPKQKKEPKPPFSKTFDVSLPSGQTVNVTVQHTKEEVQRPVKVEDGVRRISDKFAVPILRKVRNTDGSVQTQTVTVPGVRVTVRFNDGTTYEQRSCCKPPDVFKTKAGVQAALRRIYRIDSGVSLNKFVREHVEVHETGEGENRVVTANVVKGGQAIRDKGVTPRLDGEDRKVLSGVIFRNGKPPKERKIKKVEGSGSPTLESKLAVG